MAQGSNDGSGVDEDLIIMWPSRQILRDLLEMVMQAEEDM
jgi:hypothetical protein